MIIFSQIASKARSSVKGVAKDVLIKVAVTLGVTAILTLVPGIRDWLWNLAATQITLASVWLLLIALTFLAAGVVGTYLLLRRALELGRIDSMTDTLRADQIDPHLEKNLAEASTRNLAFAALLVDIDNFKAINDDHNHEIGNHTLAEVARTIRPRSPGEEIFRYGGDEFLIIAKQGMDERECWGYAKRIVRDVAEFDFLGEVNSTQPIKLTVSCGCTIVAPGDTTEKIRRRLVEALKRAKQPTGENPKGKNAAFFAKDTKNQTMEES